MYITIIMPTIHIIKTKPKVLLKTYDFASFINIKSINTRGALSAQTDSLNFHFHKGLEQKALRISGSVAVKKSLLSDPPVGGEFQTFPAKRTEI